MAIAQIEEWLKSTRNFDAGRGLYEHFGDSDFLKKMFAQSGDTEYNRERLVKELRTLSVKMPGISVERVKFTAPTSSQYNKLPKEILAAMKEKDEMFKRMRYLHGQLLNLRSIQKRKEYALQIVLLERQVNEKWRLLDHWELNRTLPEEPKVVLKKMNQLQMVRRRDNLRTYITKFEHDPIKATKVKEWIAEKKVLDEQLTA